MEETIGYEALFEPEQWASMNFCDWEESPPPSSLPEPDALTMAKSLQDYELVTVTDIGGGNCFGFWLVIRDERFDLEYQIGSHADYWDFLSYFAAGQMRPHPAFVRSLRAANSGGENRNTKVSTSNRTGAEVA